MRRLQFCRKPAFFFVGRVSPEMLHMQDMTQFSHYFVSFVAQEDHLGGMEEALRLAEGKLLPLSQIHRPKSLRVCRIEDFKRELS